MKTSSGLAPPATVVTELGLVGFLTSKISILLFTSSAAYTYLPWAVTALPISSEQADPFVATLPVCVGLAGFEMLYTRKVSCDKTYAYVPCTYTLHGV